MEILFGDEIQKDGIDGTRHREVITHSRDRENHSRYVRKIPAAANVWDTIFLFKIRSRTHDDAGGAAIGIAAHKRGGKDVEMPASAFARGIKTLEIDDGNVLFHFCPLSLEPYFR